MPQETITSKEIAKKILSWHLESAWDIDDIMETLQDYWLLNNLWKKVRKEIREITYKDKPVENNYKDRTRLARESFDDWTKDYLIREYKKNWINPRADKFIKDFITNQQKWA